ncbi:MAG: Ig-like domain-containing protein [Lachnospiraceae bacterium]|nr:Ig-like domain-containing protein [Lachnospiraceae bacterium]
MFHIRRVSRRNGVAYSELPHNNTFEYDGTAKSCAKPLFKSPYSGETTGIHVYYAKQSGAKFKTKSEVIAAMKEESPVEVGTYLVVFTLEEQRNIAATAEDDYIEYGTLTIIKGKNPLSVRDISAGVNGRSVDLGAAVMSSAGSLSYEIEGEALGCSIKGSTLTTGNTAGTVIVKVSDTGNDNYESGTGSFIVNIKDMKFETMSITQKSITYGEELPDAIPSPYTWKIEPVAQYTGLLLDGSSYSSSEKPEKVGLYMVTLTGETDDTVYTGSAEFSIAQKEVTISGIKVLDKIYDGTDEAEFDTSAMSLSGIIPGEDAELNIGGVFADASAGKNKDVNIIETWFEGADAANYVAGEISDTVKAEIKPRPVTVTAKDQDLAVGATVASGTEYAVLEGGVYAHSLSSVKITGDTSAKTESGKLVPSEAKIMDGSSADVTSNYSITYVNGTLRVAGRSIEDAVVEVGGSYCYSGEEIIPKDADISVSLGDDVLKKGIDYKISLSDNVNSGMAVIIAEGMGNYRGKTEGSFIIEPRTVTDPDIEVAPASYTGAAAEPHVSVTDDNGYVINPAEYSLVYSNNIKVSDEAVVTVVDKEGGNYTVSGSAKFAIKKGAQKSLEDIIRNVGSKTKEISVPLSSAVPAEMGTVSRYDIYDEEITSGSVIVDDAAIGSDGILKLQIHGGNAGDAIIQSVLITGQNFDCVICVRVRLNDLADPEYTAPQAKELEYTGKAQALLKAGSVSRGGTMEYSSDGYEWSTSVPEGTESGYYTVYWRITETEEINGVDSTPISVYIKGMSYKLTVQNGSGSGSYEAGESVVIVADAPASGKVFDKWSSDDDILFTDPFAATTSFSMPSKAVTVKATYKADEKPQPVLTKAPVPRDMKYDYNSQVLVEKGTASGGTLYYALGDTNKKAPEESRYKVSVPVGKDPGYYYVWYYIKGDLSHGNTAPACITAVIKKADGSMPDAPKGEDVPDPVIDPGYRDSAFCGVPAIDSTTVELHLVKGQKFNMPEKGWKSDKSKVIKISKSGALTVKKTTAITDPVTLSHDGRLDIKVYVTQPHFSDKSLKMEAGESRNCNLILEVAELPVFYSSASPDVATVDQSGTVKAVSKGTAVITAYVNAKAYTCKIKVSESEAAAERTLHLSKGSKKTVNIKGLRKVEWESSEASVVSVSKKNKLKAEAVGTAELSTVYDGKTYIIHVTVEDPVFITEGIRGSKNKYSVSMKVADVKQLDLKAPGFDKPDTRQLAFKSSKPSVAFIDEQGRLIAIGKGKTKLTAKINGKNVTLSVTVK